MSEIPLGIFCMSGLVVAVWGAIWFKIWTDHHDFMALAISSEAKKVRQVRNARELNTDLLSMKKRGLHLAAEQLKDVRDRHIVKAREYAEDATRYLEKDRLKRKTKESKLKPATA